MFFIENLLINVLIVCVSGWIRCSKCCRSWIIFKFIFKNKMVYVDVYECRGSIGLNYFLLKDVRIILISKIVFFVWIIIIYI